MALTVEIDGLEREFIDRDAAISWEKGVNGQGNAAFVYADTPDGFVPDDGMAVIIKEDGTNRFLGLINKRPRQFRGPDHSNQLTFYRIEVGSYELLLNKRRVSKAYTNVAFEDIIADWLADANILSGEGITLDVTAGTALTYVFNGESIPEALDILCALEADGRTWRMSSTTAKLLIIKTLAEIATPTELNTLTLLGISDGVPAPSLEPDRSGYHNRYTVVGGGPDLPISFTATDAVEIAARAAVETGTTGIYHGHAEDPEARSSDSVEAVAEARLAQDVTLRQRFVGTTDTAGFEAGQQGVVDLPNIGLDEVTMYVESVRTYSDPGVTGFVHEVTMITGDPDGGWQTFYRREKRRPKTIPFQVEPVPGLVRVESEEGVLVHDPVHDPTEFFQGVASGVQDESVSAIGITPDGIAMYSLRRDAGPPAETVLEKWAITSNQPATTTSGEFRWAELAATGFKTELLISPNGTRGAYLQLGTPDILGIIDLVNGVLLGSVNTAISNNANPGEPVWSPDGNWIFWGDIAAGNIHVYHVVDPSNPVEDNVFALATLTNVGGLVISADGDSLVATGAGGIAGINVTDPTAPVQDTTVVGAADYISLDIDAGLAVGMVRANGTQCRVITLNVTGSTVTLNTEQLVGVVTSVMVGSHVIHHDGSALCFSHRISLAGPNTLEAHVFNTTDPAAVTFVETFSYTHGAAGHVGPVKTIRALAALWVFGNGTDAQVTHGVEQFDQVEPYEIQVVRTDWGGTGNVSPYQKGTLLVGNGRGGDTELTKLGGPLDDQVLTGDEDEATGVKWGHELSRGYHFGAFREAFDALVTSDGVTVTMSLEQRGTGDLTLIFTDGLTLLDCTPALTIALIAGSDTSPTFNYVYILQSDKILTVSTVGYPATEHNKVGVFFVPSAAKVQSDGVFVNQNINDFLYGGTESMGHGLHIADAIRHMGARWNSGVDGNGTTGYLTIVTNAGTPDNVFFKSTAGVVYQLHRHAFDAEDTSGAGRILVVNDSVAAYDEISDIADLLLDSAGGSMVGKYFNLHFWGVANHTGEFQPVMCNLPSGSYNKQSDAEQDVSGFDDSSIPAAFDRESTTGFLIVRVTLRHQAASGGTWTHVSAVDIRRTAPGAIGGGSGIVTTEFADNAFDIFDESDPTKIIKFEASGIATGNTRTVTAEDGPMTIPLTSEWDDLTDAGDTVLHKHDIYLLADGTRTLSADWNAGAHTIFVNDTANAFMTLGLTINQGAADNEIVTLKSSDVAHGMTTRSEADTFGTLLKHHATEGGLQIRGFSSTITAIAFKPGCTTEDATRSTSAVGCFVLDGKLKAGTSWGAMSADKNLFVLSNSGIATYIFTTDGATWQTGGVTATTGAFSGTVITGHPLTVVRANANVNLILRNDQAVPAAVGIGSMVFQTQDDGSNLTSYVLFEGVAETITNLSEDGYFRCRTIRGGSIAQRFRAGSGMIIGSSTSDPGVGILLADTALHVGALAPGTGSSYIVLADGTTPSSLSTNTAGLYTNDVGGTVEMFAIDEAGNSAQLTPHNFELFEPDDAEAYPWSYFSRNDYLGVEIGVDFARLVRLIQQQSGQKLIHTRPAAIRLDWVDDQETHMRRRMTDYERWEANPKERDDGELIPAPALPQLKQPPKWLRKRLKAKGLLNAAKATALQQELEQWMATRNL